MIEPRIEFRPTWGLSTTLATEVFRSPAERHQGLRNRTSWVRPSATFVFPEPDYPTFEMKDTPNDLDIVFVARADDEHGVVVHVENATAHVTTVRPTEAVQWVIELPAGAAKEFGIVRGVPVTFVDVGEAID